MSLFKKKKKTAFELKQEIKQLEEELKEIQGEGAGQAAVPESDAVKEAPRAPSPQPLGKRSATNALFATLSHELRTPLNGVLGMAQLLHEKNADPRLETLESCAQHIQSVLHTLVNLAKIQEEWGHLPEFREWINLHDFMEQVKRNLSLRCAKRRLTISLVHQDNQIRLRMDYDHLINIVETAILGSLESVDVNTSIDSSKLEIEWSVEEDQVKIVIVNPLEVMPRARGQRISEVSELTTSDNHSRIGMEFLYWAVSTSLLEDHDGGMVCNKLNDDIGVKTTLAFKVESMKASPSDQRPIGGLSIPTDKKVNALTELPFCLRVLVVEDDPINRELMLLLLERIGQKVTLAANGQIALDLMDEDPSYDLILMDIDMPVLNGIATTQAFRIGEAGEVGMYIPIVAVTAFNALSDWSRFKRAGMNYFLSKPVSLKDLRSVLLEVTRNS